MKMNYEYEIYDIQEQIKKIKKELINLNEVVAAISEAVWDD